MEPTIKASTNTVQAASGESTLNKTGAIRTFSMPVESREGGKPYVHIELGAGNYRYEEGKLEYLSTQELKKIHERSCSCTNCDYDSNRPRYRTLEQTIKYLAKTTEASEIELYLNDLDVVGLDQAAKYANEHISRQHKEDVSRIKVNSLPGNMFDLDIKGLQPNSVHLKNPDNKIFRHLESQPEDFVNLLQQCHSCDSRGLIVVSPERRFATVFPYLSYFVSFKCEKYPLPFEVNYHRTNTPVAANSWRERATVLNFQSSDCA